jgi:hypothetical protein
MTARPVMHHDRDAGVADLPRRASGWPSPEDAIAEGTASHPGRDRTASGWAHSADEAFRLAGLSRDLLSDQIRRGQLGHVKVGQRCLTARHHLQQILGIAS